MRIAWLLTGFVVGACVSTLHSGIREYTINSSLPTAVFLETEETNPKRDLPASEANGFKCYRAEDSKAMKRYIVDLEQQIISCEARLPSK